MPRWIVLALALMAPVAAADPGIDFEHHDWLLACDNTGTCRAAGYQSEAATLPVSVLLTRHAGPGQPVNAVVQIGEAWDASEPSAGPAFPLSLRIDGRDLGTVAAGNGDLVSGTLSPAQTAALLEALARDSRIEWTSADGKVHVLSDRGAAAVLLKMDEAQGRVGTRGALLRPGTRDESAVPPSRPLPVVRAPATDDTDIVLPPGERAALVRELKAQLEPDACPDLSSGPDAEADEDAERLAVTGLSHGKRLASLPCWLAAYNAGSAYWVIDADAPYRPVLVTTNGSGYGGGRIDASHKGRGLGDCWSSRGWTWDGVAFVVSHEQTSGLCRGFPGGAWTLPTRVSDVRAGASAAAPAAHGDEG
ncbi:DUF1176 domain-containing protein [Marilutibacter chinensis]|uniref:DUF1176 domain-containing protein n=1 Tax=Marilutibacter chinensis TaxID=2912247 RepID=A0ABS9HUK8_9GAMM|nr:DUF1176 domain-containing protein [Lysobacter chinensis]MCF7222191.1 DUF1176 domain-containing protein [Lysobacter chinensis]